MLTFTSPDAVVMILVIDRHKTGDINTFMSLHKSHVICFFNQLI